jgi:hypothetical protein
LTTTQIAVIFCETSRPTKWDIDESPKLRITGVSAQIAALSVDHAGTAIIGFPYASRHDNAFKDYLLGKTLCTTSRWLIFGMSPTRQMIRH